MQIDLVTGKWSRRPAGVAKEMWDRLPHLQQHMQLLGPQLFTDEDLRGVQGIPSLPEDLVDITIGKENQGLDADGTYDVPIDLTGESEPVGPGPSSSSGDALPTADGPEGKMLKLPLMLDVLSNNNIDISGMAIVRYLAEPDLVIDNALQRFGKPESFNHQSDRDKLSPWTRHSTYWTYGKPIVIVLFQR